MAQRMTKKRSDVIPKAVMSAAFSLLPEPPLTFLKPPSPGRHLNISVQLQ
jgi:hypothetical protein